MATAPCKVPTWLNSSLIVAAALALMGCNLITTADSLSIAEGDEAKSPASAGSGNNTNTGGAGGTMGNGGAGATGAGPGAGGGGAGGPVDTMVAADGVSITDIVIYQSVARPIMANGAAVDDTTPVVANRDALFRVFYSTSGYNGLPVTARLTIGANAPLVAEGVLGNGSSEGNPSSTVNFLVPADLMTMGGNYRVDLVQQPEQASGQNGAARYPQAVAEQVSLQTEASGKLTVTLVPVQYNADGSGRLPDTSTPQLQKYADLFYAMYPVTDVEIKVRNAYPWNSAIQSGGGGWDSMLNAIADLRNADNAPFAEYYYGIFNPTTSFNTYCNGGCVLGLGFVGGPQDEWAHSAIGIGFTGDRAIETAVHELGHNHGRNHAPCGGAAGTDGSYPYSGAGIGRYGFNLITGELFSPSSHVDMMSYCDPAWISDYTYNALFSRVKFTSGSQASWYVPPAMLNHSWERALIKPDGTTSWMPPIQLERPMVGVPVAMTAETTSGPEQLTGNFIPYDHIEGGVLFIPPTAAPKIAGAQMAALIKGQSHLILQ